MSNGNSFRSEKIARIPVCAVGEGNKYYRVLISLIRHCRFSPDCPNLSSNYHKYFLEHNIWNVFVTASDCGHGEWCFAKNLPSRHATKPGRSSLSASSTAFIIYCLTHSHFSAQNIFRTNFRVGRGDLRKIFIFLSESGNMYQQKHSRKLACRRNILWSGSGRSYCLSICVENEHLFHHHRHSIHKFTPNGHSHWPPFFTSTASSCL